MARATNTIEKSLKIHLKPKQRMLIAVSGGKDSACLLDAVAKISERMKFHVEVAHVDHGFRKSSHLDARFVAKLSKNYNFKFHLKKLPKKPAKENLEAWGRKKRYEFFTKVLSESKLDFVLTAHNADDVAETFLIKLVSNKELTNIEERDSKRKVLRPLLKVSRKEIDAYQKLHKIKFREDPSNKDTKFLRNKIRHKLIPLFLKEFDARITETISERARAVSEDIDTLYDCAESSLIKARKLEFGSRPWLRTVQLELKTMQTAVAWRFAERLFKDKLGFNLGRVKSKELIKVLQQSSAGLELPSGATVRQQGGGIRLNLYM